MTFAAFIEAHQGDVIRKILEHCGLWQDPPSPMLPAQSNQFGRCPIWIPPSPARRIPSSSNTPATNSSASRNCPGKPQTTRHLGPLVNLALDAAKSGYTMRQELEPRSVPGGLKGQVMGIDGPAATMDQAAPHLWAPRGAHNASLSPQTPLPRGSNPDREASNFLSVIRVAHYPSYCSKYNPIEYRLFAHVGSACKGLLFDMLETVTGLMRKASTSTGLKTTPNITRRSYETGRKVAGVPFQTGQRQAPRIPVVAELRGVEKYTYG